MSVYKTLNYSPNFNTKKRKPNQIKFIIFHYTGMKNESEAIERLTSIKSKVSSHYLIKNNGEIVVMVPDLYVAWHAGVSSWKNFKSLNKYSIGIEISNPGHDYDYKKFSKKQIQSLKKLCKFLMKKYKILITQDSHLVVYPNFFFNIPRNSIWCGAVSTLIIMIDQLRLINLLHRLKIS